MARNRKSDYTIETAAPQEKPDTKISITSNNSVQARTDNQKEYIRAMAENDITICIGPAGSGKTYVSVGLAVEYLAFGKVKRLIFSRPIVNCGKGLGFLPGSLEDKTHKYFQPVREILEDFLGIDQLRFLTAKGIIQFEPLETMRGHSIKNTFLVVDEASNCEYEQLKMVMSRFDVGSKFVLNGDPTQCDLHYCDLPDVVSRVENVDNLAICELTREDIQRPKIVMDITDAMERQND